MDYGNGTMSIDQYDTQSGTAFGHSNAAGAESVGAAAWFNTRALGRAFPSDVCTGVLRIFLLSRRSADSLRHEGESFEGAADPRQAGHYGTGRGNTSFFYSLFTFSVPGSTEPDQFPNFFGTSAAAPHAAAVAALMIDAARHGEERRSPSPDRIYHILRKTAIDIEASAGRGIGPFPFAHPEGFDFDSGFGLSNAVAAVGEAGDD